MSFYRTLAAAIAALGLATSVFAADESTTSGSSDTSNTITQQTTTESSVTTTQTQLNVNKATISELSKIQLDGKPLGKVKAKAIVSYRNAHKKDGGFQSLDELKKVNGFRKLNDDQLKAIQDQLTV